TSESGFDVTRARMRTPCRPPPLFTGWYASTVSCFASASLSTSMNRLRIDWSEIASTVSEELSDTTAYPTGYFDAAFEKCPRLGLGLASNTVRQLVFSTWSRCWGERS